MVDYRREMLRTSPDTMEMREQLAIAGLGLAGEAGECADLIKKVLFHGKQIDRDELIKEMGDVRWYLEYLAWVLGVSMEEVEERNVEKLRARYMHGFSHGASNNRKE
jgi:NTP pyrophosphatase (non-canonical NTP hydrolase)